MAEDNENMEKEVVNDIQEEIIPETSDVMEQINEETSGADVPEKEEPQRQIVYIQPEKKSKAPLIIMSVLFALAMIFIAFQSVFIFLLTSGRLEKSSQAFDHYIESAGLKSDKKEVSALADPNFSLEEAASVHDPNKKTLSTVEIYDKVSPATVAIYLVDQASESVSAGSGFIISEDGYIVTNAHVIENASDKTELKVYIGGQEEAYEAGIVGTDIQTDIAVIKISSDEPLPTVTLGDSDVLQNGELAIAIGNPLGTLQGTITVGVISGMERPMNTKGYSMKLIQTDASVNEGNSGGPLVNSFGEVIGVVNAKIGTAEGLGFAIPISSIKSNIESIIVNGKVINRPYLGTTVKFVAANDYFGADDGVYVAELVKDGPGDKAGFKIGDRILTMDGVEIKESDDIIGVRDSHNVGDEVEVVVDRDGEKVTLTLEIGDSADYE